MTQNFLIWVTGLVVWYHYLPRFLFYFYLFISFLVSLWHMKFLAQESDLSHSCNPCCSCSNTGSLTHCARLGIKAVCQHCRDAADHIVSQWELSKIFLSMSGINLVHASNLVYVLLHEEDLFFYSRLRQNTVCVCVCVCVFICVCICVCVCIYSCTSISWLFLYNT